MRCRQDINAKHSIEAIKKTVHFAKVGIIINCHKHRDESRHNFISNFVHSVAKKIQRGITGLGVNT